MSTPFARTCTLPPAALAFSKTDGTTEGALNEPESIQPKDSDLLHRVVDCKYLHRLDVSSLEPNVANRAGTYKVGDDRRREGPNRRCSTCSSTSGGP